VLADPTDPTRILGGLLDVAPLTVSTFAYVRRSTNAGSTWSSAFAPNADHGENQRISSFFFDASSNTEAYFSLGTHTGNNFGVGLVRTTDAGATWNPWMNGLAGLNVLDVDSDATGRVFVRGAMKRGLWSAPAAGQNWADLSWTGPGSFFPTAFQVNPSIPGILYEAGVTFSFDTADPHFMFSNDAGLTWDAVPFPQEGFAIEPSVIVADHLNGQTIYVWSNSDGLTPYLSRWTNGEEGFQVVHEGFLAAGAVVSSPQRVFAIRKDAPGDVQLTTDGGVTWSPRSTGLPAGQAVALLGDPSAQDRLAAVYRTAGVFQTTNEGLSWSSVPLPGYASQIVLAADWDPASTRFFLVTQSAGVYVSGAGFVAAGMSTTKLTSICYESQSQNVLVGTEHASVLRLDLGGAVDTPATAVAQSDFAIRVHPNPSSDEFHFEVNLLNAAERALLSIYDVRGRRIASPFSGVLSPGIHRIDWRGQTNLGVRALPGIYFARFEAGGRVATTRITLVGGESR
jgi:hypothetical protein